ncbi:hypothetical protein ACPC54_40710 [Kitasatospora sp. NPDC094028]
MESGSRIAVESACRDLTTAGPFEGPVGSEVAAALEGARGWLVRQARERQELFDQLRQALRDREVEAVRALLARADAQAAGERDRAEHSVASRAEEFLKHQQSQAGWARATKRAHRANARTARVRNVTTRAPNTADPTEIAHQRVRHILGDLRRMGTSLGPRTMLHMLDSLATTMKSAGARVTPAQREEAQLWLARGRRLRGAATAEAAVLPGAAAGVPASRRSPEAGTAGGSAAGGRGRQDKGEAAPVPAERRAASAGRPERSKKVASAGPPRLSAASIASVAAAVAGALKKAARERSATSWPRLRRQLGGALPDLHPDDKLEVLLQVEAGTVANEPLLSSLLAANGGSPPALYQGLARHLGRTLPTDVGAARTYWQSEVLRLHQLFRYR